MPLVANEESCRVCFYGFYVFDAKYILKGKALIQITNFSAFFQHTQN